MYSPKEVFTSTGLKDWEYTLQSLDRALFMIANNADDLHIPEEIMDAVRELQIACEEGVAGQDPGVLWTGNGETDDDV